VRNVASPGQYTAPTVARAGQSKTSERGPPSGCAFLRACGMQLLEDSEEGGGPKDFVSDQLNVHLSD